MQEVATSGAAALDRRLRARALPDAHLAGVAPIAAPGGEVLATRDGAALWARAGLLDLAAAAPLELAEHESLRDRLQKGRSAALLALVHLLRELTADRRWQPPAARAALLFDDPNLHWPSYGFLHLPELVRDAEEHGYHLSLATIPLDWWFAHPRALSLLREHPAALSLVFHGNNHTGRELGQPGERGGGRRARRPGAAPRAGVRAPLGCRGAARDGAAARGVLGVDRARPAALRASRRSP